MTKDIKKVIDFLVKKEINHLAETFRGFSLKAFKKLDDAKKMNQYAKKHLPVLGEGGQRITYGLGKGKILKIARDNRLNRQTRQEVEFFTRPNLDPVTVRVYDFDNEQFLWIVMEAVKIIADNSNLFSKFSVPEYVLNLVEKAGMQGKDLLDSLVSALKKYNEENIYNENSTMFVIPPGAKEKMTFKDLNDLDIELIKKIYYAGSQGLIDTDRYDHWGMNTNGQLVLADFGMEKLSI